MTTPHRATPEQWALVEQYAEVDCYSDACLLELRDRLAAAEQRISELENAAEPTFTPEEAEMIAAPWSLLTPEPASAAPAGSLVEVVGRTWSYGQPLHPAATRAAILACADWLERQDVGAGHAAARWLREEVERG